MAQIITKKVIANEEELNRDPITGTPGAHHWAQVPVLHQAALRVLPSAWPWAGR